jgi:hypothetical protein
MDRFYFVEIYHFFITRGEKNAAVKQTSTPKREGDGGVMTAFGIIGYFMKKGNIRLGPSYSVLPRE